MLSEMRFKVLALITVVVWSSAAVFAQDLAGTWQGTLSTPEAQIRIVLRITRAADGRFEGQLFAIDQGAQPRPMSAISLDGRVVKWKADALSATYEGTLTADGNAMNGAVTQAGAGQPQVLNLVRATPQTAWSIREPAASPTPMDQAADPGI